MCFKFWRTKKLPSERRKQAPSKSAEEKDDNDIAMNDLKRNIEAINKVREASRLRRKEDETENVDQSEPIPPKVSFYLDPNPERYDLDLYLSSPRFQNVVVVDGDDEDDVSDNDKKRCHLF